MSTIHIASPTGDIILCLVTIKLIRTIARNQEELVTNG